VTGIDAFDELMSGLDQPLVVVTTVHDGERAGCLVGFHVQCSIEPRRYAVWLSKANHTFRVGIHSDVFAIHLLGRDDRELAELFGTTTGDEADKFTRCDWHPGPGDVPLLDGCPNRIIAQKHTLLDDGSDHVCLVVEPIRVDGGGDFAPLRLSEAGHLDPGHEAEERPAPPTERAADQPAN
jgi:flavin reductase (DIM6/NTAB) family NADH-FMN oxidoreductase RutF